MTRTAAPLLAVIGIVLAACDSPTSQRASSTEIRDSLGITMVMNRGGVDSTFALDPELRIGSLDSDAPDLFSQVVAVGVTPDGSIVVGDAMSTSARVFDADGTFRVEFGRRGEGPEEISQLDDLHVVGDTVLLVDWQRGGTVARYTASGEFATSVSMTPVDGLWVSPMGHDGQSWLAYVPRPRTQILDEGEPVDERAIIKRFDWDSPSPGVEAYSRLAEQMYGVSTGTTGVDWPLFGRVLEGDGFDAAGRYYDASLTHYAVQLWNADGLEQIIRREVARVPVSPEVVAEVRTAAIEIVGRLVRDQGAPAAVLDQQVEQVGETVLTRAAHMRTDSVPPIAALMVGRDGALWVNRRDGPDLAQVEAEAMFHSRPGVRARSTRWDIFAPGGRFRGSLDVPPRTRVHVVSEHHAWGVALDDLDVPFVFRWSLAPTPR